MSELSPCAVCGGDVSSDYKCPGPCGRGINYFCGKRIGGLSDEPCKNSTRRCSSSSCSTQARPEEVSHYINRSGGQDSRLGWWTVHANRSLFRLRKWLDLCHLFESQALWLSSVSRSPSKIKLWQKNGQICLQIKVLYFFVLAWTCTFCSI